MSGKSSELTQNLKKSTRCMQEVGSSPFAKAEDLCKILESCAKSGVTVLKFGQLEVSFLPHPTIPGDAAPTPAAVVTGKPTQTQIKAENLSIEEQALALREMQIAELRFTDPLLAEELMEDGELVAGDSTDGDGSGETFDIGPGEAVPGG